MNPSSEGCRGISKVTTQASVFAPGSSYRQTRNLGQTRRDYCDPYLSRYHLHLFQGVKSGMGVVVQKPRAFVRMSRLEPA